MVRNLIARAEAVAECDSHWWVDPAAHDRFCELVADKKTFTILLERTGPTTAEYTFLAKNNELLGTVVKTVRE